MFQTKQSSKHIQSPKHSKQLATATPTGLRLHEKFKMENSRFNQTLRCSSRNLLGRERVFSCLSGCRKHVLSGKLGVNLSPTTELIKSSCLLLLQMSGKERKGWGFPDWYMIIRYHQVVLLHLCTVCTYCEGTVLPCSADGDIIHLAGSSESEPWKQETEPDFPSSLSASLLQRIFLDYVCKVPARFTDYEIQAYSAAPGKRFDGNLKTWTVDMYKFILQGRTVVAANTLGKHFPGGGIGWFFFST